YFVPVCVLVATMLTPGRTANDESDTAPVIVPRSLCASVSAGSDSTRQATAIVKTILLDIRFLYPKAATRFVEMGQTRVFPSWNRRGGRASRKCREASFEGADGVVSSAKRRCAGLTTPSAPLRNASLFLMAQPPLLS